MKLYPFPQTREMRVRLGRAMLMNQNYFNEQKVINIKFLEKRGVPREAILRAPDLYSRGTLD